MICYHVMFSADIYSPAEYMLSETRAEAKFNSFLDKECETSQVFARLLGWDRGRFVFPMLCIWIIISPTQQDTVTCSA